MAIVYQHRRKDTREVFYVGIGKSKKRAYDKIARSDFWKCYTSKHEFEVEITHKDIIWEEACSIEKYLIAFYGRRDLSLGSLLNQTDGGEGGDINHSKEVIQKMRLAKIGKKLTLIHKKKISISGKGRKHSEKTKTILSEKKLGSKNPMYGITPWNKGKPQTIETKEKLRQANLGKKQSEDTRKKRSETMKNTLKNKKTNS